MVQLLWKSLVVPLLNMELPNNLAVPVLGMCPREIKTYVYSKRWTQIFTVASFIIAKKWKHHKCPSADGWINKMWYVHTNECYSTIKGYEELIQATIWMNLETIVLSEGSQSHIVILFV